MTDRTTTQPPGKGPLVLAGIALTVAIVLPLLVWTYAKTGTDETQPSDYLADAGDPEVEDVLDPIATPKPT